MMPDKSSLYLVIVTDENYQLTFDLKTREKAQDILSNLLRTLSNGDSEGGGFRRIFFSLIQWMNKQEETLSLLKRFLLLKRPAVISGECSFTILCQPANESWMAENWIFIPSTGVYNILFSFLTVHHIYCMYLVCGRSILSRWECCSSNGQQVMISWNVLGGYCILMCGFCTLTRSLAYTHIHTHKLCSSGGEAGAAVYGAEVTTFTHRCKVQQSWERSHVDKRAVCVCPVVCLSVVAVTFSLPLTSLSRLAGSQLPYRGTESDRAELRDAAMRLWAASHCRRVSA